MGCCLEVDQVALQYCPLPELLIDHLVQGVWQCCLFPQWNHGDKQLLALDFVTEDIEGVFPEIGDPQDDEPVDPAAFLAA